MPDTTERRRPRKTHLITQGEFAVSDDPELVISTLLGSCVSCCLWDEVAGVGGMNHLLLAGRKLEGNPTYDLAGVAEMEYLINGIIKLGGKRERLRCKVFGGAQMLGNITKIGASNAQFAFEFLAQEQIECLGSSIGGRNARAVRFWPVSGRVNMRFVTDAPPEPVTRTTEAPEGNDLELF